MRVYISISFSGVETSSLIIFLLRRHWQTRNRSVLASSLVRGGVSDSTRIEQISLVIFRALPTSSDAAFKVPYASALETRYCSLIDWLLVADSSSSFGAEDIRMGEHMYAI